MTRAERIAALRRRMPTRDGLLANRWARPFARYLGHPRLWHWNRRGAARGLALGLFFGVLIPFIQSPFAFAAAVPLRANLPMAFLGTLITNPFTTPFIYVAAFALGSDILAADMVAGAPGEGAMAVAARTLSWLLTASVPTALGLLIMASIAGAAGFVAVHGAWRWRTGRRWRTRHRRRKAGS